jgi:hypothetical protein
MLVQIALVIFGMFGMLAVIADVGYVRLTQVQMQNAADVASLEGLRARDAVVDPVTGQPDGFASDCMRRLAARDLARWSFDDDFDLSADVRSFGAGPNITFTEGTPDLSAGQHMYVSAAPEERAYKPVLQLNHTGTDAEGATVQNARYGDMVSGTFDPGGLPIDVPGRFETPLYERTDFTPDTVASDPGASGLPGCPDDLIVSSTDPWAGLPSGTLPLGDRAFLVRFRRSSVLNDFDELPGISSRGTGLPLLFGRGTLVQGGDPDSEYLPRRDGLTVRATAIADARPAVRIGAAPLLAPAGRLRITSDFFTTLETGTQTATLTTTGSIVAAGNTVGMFIDAATVITIGDSAGTLAPTPPLACDPLAANNVVPVLSAVVTPVDATDRVVGFAMITVAWPDCAMSPLSVAVALTRLDGPLVAAGNVTALLDADFPIADAPLLAAVHAFVGAGPAFSPSVVWAPVLVK